MLKENKKAILYNSSLNEVLPANSEDFFHILQFQPQPLLQTYIDSYTILIGKNDLACPFSWHIMPDNASYLTFHLFELNKSQAIRSRFSLVGPRSKHIKINRSYRKISLVVRFWPGGVRPFFPISLVDLTDRSIRFSELCGEPALELQEKLTDHLLKQDFKQSLFFLEQFFIRQLTPKRLSFAVQSVIQKIQLTKGLISIKDLAQQMGFSQRYLQKLTLDHIGMPPKKLARIQRVTHAVQLFCDGWEDSWAALAYDTGFFDQAHMIDEFQMLLGKSPGKFFTS